MLFFFLKKKTDVCFSPPEGPSWEHLLPSNVRALGRKAQQPLTGLDYLLHLGSAKPHLLDIELQCRYD
jgi:hypothetical protein